MHLISKEENKKLLIDSMISDANLGILHQHFPCILMYIVNKKQNIFQKKKKQKTKLNLEKPFSRNVIILLIELEEFTATLKMFIQEKSSADRMLVEEFNNHLIGFFESSCQDFDKNWMSEYINIINIFNLRIWHMQCIVQNFEQKCQWLLLMIGFLTSNLTKFFNFF